MAFEFRTIFVATAAITSSPDSGPCSIGSQLNEEADEGFEVFAATDSGLRAPVGTTFWLRKPKITEPQT
jgi:hypothetical protein